MEHLAGSPLLLVTTYRPGYHPTWLGKSYATQLTVPPLTEAESGRLVGALWPPAQQGAALVARILTRAQGNPLFLEELTRAVQEQEGWAPGRVRDTIQAVLAARIARLPRAEQHLLQTAAIIGTEVPVPLLAAIAALPEAVLQDRLAHLQEAEFLYADTARARAGLDLQARPDAGGGLRRPAPGAAAGATRTHCRGPRSAGARAGGEQVERLAHHALRGEVWDKAVTYCQQAGTGARDSAASGEAAASYEHALPGSRAPARGRRYQRAGHRAPLRI